MPKITIDLTDEEYVSIPGKKKPWAERIIREALNGKTINLVPTFTYVFTTEDGPKVSSGISPADAAQKIGLTQMEVLEYKLMHEQKEESPLDV